MAVSSRACRRGWLLLAVCLSVPGWAAVPEAPVPVPIDPVAYEVYASQYAYDPTLPLNVEVVSSQTMQGTRLERLRFDSVNGQRVPGLLVVPPGDGPRPVILMLHGLGGDKEMLAQLAPMLGMFGIPYAFLALDAPYHGERRFDLDLLCPNVSTIVEGYVQGVVDYRRAIDLIAERPDLDETRVGVAGMSMGAMMGTILTAVDPRVRTAAMIVGGGDWGTILNNADLEPIRAIREAPGIDWVHTMNRLQLVDPANYAGHLGDRPVLFVNGTRDTIIPRASAERLHEAAMGPNTVIEWMDSDHMLPADVTAQRLLQWFMETL